MSLHALSFFPRLGGNVLSSLRRTLIGRRSEFPSDLPGRSPGQVQQEASPGVYALLAGYNRR